MVGVHMEADQKIDPGSLTGGFKNVVPGQNKKIIWDGKNDVTDPVGNMSIRIEAIPLVTLTRPTTSRGKAIVLSTFFPGWGSAKTTLRNGNFVKGAVAYCALGAGAYFYSQSQNTYDKYLKSFDIQQRKDYFDDAESQYNIAQYCFIAGISMWVIDYATILLAKNRSATSGNLKKSISFYQVVDPVIGEPLLAVKISF